MNLIKAKISNISALMPLIEQFYTHFSYAFDDKKHQSLVEYFLSHDFLGSIWLVQIQGQYVGYIALTYGFTFEFGGRDAFIDEFFIAESHRSQGIGAQALLSVQQKMAELGLVALHLQTEKYNQRAKQLYLSLGFKDLERSTLTFLRQE